MSLPALKKGHVNFGSEEDCFPRDNLLTIRQISLDRIQINLGFLQYQHTYSISLDIPKAYFLGYDLQSVLVAADKSPPNSNCRILSITESGEFYAFIVEFHADKERLVKEELKFCLEEHKIVVEFNARVLGLGKGTPLLKNGIKCIKVGTDESSEVSDWQPD